MQIDSALHRSLNPSAKTVKEEEEDDDDEAIDVDPPASSTHALQRPESGEVRWWITAAVSKGRGSDDDYGWGGLGGTFLEEIQADRRRGDRHHRRPRPADPLGCVVAIRPE